MTSSAVASIPGSKSLTNRALLLAAAADGTSELRGPLISDDTVAFVRCLIAMGYQVETGDDAVWTVHGTASGPVVERVELDCVDAGTAARFLPGLAAAGVGTFRFDGSDQLRRRPLRPLLDVLGTLGASISGDGAPGQDLPFVMEADGLAGGDVEIDGAASSQYLTGLLLAAPLMRRPLRVRVRSLVSSPYIDMSIGLMRLFGVDVDADGHETFAVRPGSYRPLAYDVEPDASTASYFFAAAALTGTSLTVPGLGSGSLQGDLEFVRILALMGVHVDMSPDCTVVIGPDRLHGDISVDMGPISDTFMTLAALAPFADGPVHIYGIGHVRGKESDRIAAMTTNLRACGITVDEGPDWVRIHPGTPGDALIACHRDHRVAMSFSVLGLCGCGIRLDDPGCVSKTFPRFHEEFGRLFPPVRRRA